ncbi:ribonuclease P protein component [Tessaracoccus antarcticus]|uniref:Ribonuclease P protein component n=1 Tax=Tessaracoccus antarcticus TaxID=2479848 RepID=A0A3M0GIR5_9ACTN|nr:ribonuclease P protein component [Tessaracoccus antarcticus]RMB61503.1 ribonuclease P protein component [Tessaracoccus antarcticus]
MLPGARRLRRPAEFSAVFSSRVRAASPSVVVHVARPEVDTPPESTRVGFVVSKKVGNAVHRNRVKRRLRHMVLNQPTPFGADVVVRALPPSAMEPNRLDEDFASAWRRAFLKASSC